MSHRTCSLSGCDNHHLALGYCRMHYLRLMTYGDPLGGHYFQKPTPQRICIIEGCGRLHNGLGMCKAHKDRYLKYGSPLGGPASKALGLAPVIDVCSIDECTSDAKAKGLCWSHLNRERYKADPQTWARYTKERRARLRDVEIEHFTPLEIFERDKWRCGICGRRIPKKLKAPDQRSASLDHIVPLIEQGPHTKANTQAAHLGCNRRKWMGGSQQLHLFG